MQSWRGRVSFGNLRVSSNADDVVLFVSSSQDLRCALRRFAVECDAAEMSQSEVMVLDGKTSLHRVEEFRFVGRTMVGWSRRWIHGS